MIRSSLRFFLHVCVGLFFGPLAAVAQAGPDHRDSAPHLARVRELGGALLSERARVRRETESALRPTLEGIEALRTALLAYRDAQEAVEEATVSRTADRAPDDAASAASAERRARRGAAREAVDVLRARRLALMATTAAPEPQEGQPILRFEVLEAIENEAEVLLATEASADSELVGRLTLLLDRLERSPPPPPPARIRPAITLHDGTGRPTEAK